MAWSYLEMQSEMTLWGLLKLDQDLCQTFIWTMGIRQRWQMIVREAKKRLPENDYQILKGINKVLMVVMRDRNIAVHGLVHAQMVLDSIPPKRTVIPDGLSGPHKFHRIPCWTIYIGEDAGKSFEISTESVIIIRENIHKLAEQIWKFNEAKSFTNRTKINDVIEQEWPKRIE